MKKQIFALVTGLLSTSLAWASTPPTTTEPEAKTIVKYKQAKEINFEQLIIEGQLKRPELSVVTGEEEQGTNGLLRLRENFVDRMTVDAGEEIQ